MDDLKKIQYERLQQIQYEMEEMYGIWEEIGLSPMQQQERVTTAWDHIHTLVRDIKTEEIALYEELKDKIRHLTEEVSGLQRALSIEAPQVAGLTYLKRLEALQQECNKLSDLKEQRMVELKEMRINEQNYCELLGVEEYKLSSEVPSKEDLKKLQQYINTLSEEHTKRYEKYCQAKRQLSTIMEVTEATPETTLEKHLCSNKEPISLSKSTFQEIEEVIAQARKRKAELENKKKILMSKLNLLWERLSIDQSFRIEFMSNHLDCKSSTLTAIQSEINKYEDMKKQNLNLFIDSVKKELEELWDKCGASEFEKKLFDPYFSNAITESVLAIHEEEVERWKKYYEEVQHILERIVKRNKLWELLKALDNKASDPERFKNRGGNLLKEEKERNKLLRTFPTLEQEIKEAIEKYEAETGKMFLYLGEDYRTIICNQWGERKENLKPEKHSTPAKRTVFATPKKSPALAIYRSGKTPQRAIQKRQLDVLKGVGAYLNENPSCSGKTPQKTIQNRQLNVLKEVGAYMNENPSCSNATGYPDFEAELNRTGRKSLRSSVVASKKIGGTRTPMSCKKRISVAKKRVSLIAEDLTSVRGKDGLPFLM